MVKKISKVLNRAEDIILVVMFAVMVIVIFAQVIMRYVFSNSSLGVKSSGSFYLYGCHGSASA